MMIRLSRFSSLFASTTIALSLGVGSSLMLVGCNNQAAQQAAANNQLAEILEIIRVAEQGFVPRGDEAESIDQFRQQQLAIAAGKLEALVSTGTIEQQVTARRLLADLRISAAKDDARQATEQWAILSNQSATVVNQLGAVLQAADRVSKLSVNESVLIEKLTNNIDQIEQASGVDMVDAEAIKDKITELARKITRVKEDRHNLITRSQAQLDAAFALDGEERHQSQLEAIRLRREADVLSSEADKIRAEASMLESQFKVLASKASIGEKHAELLSRQVTESRQRDTQTSAARDEAVSQRDELLAEFEKSYEILVSQMQTQVIEPMQLAIDRIATTEASLNQIKSQAGNVRGLGSEIELDILRTRSDRAYLHAQQAIMLGSFGQTLRMIAQQVNTAAPNRAEFYQTTARNITQTQEQIIQSAASLISDANTSGQNLIASGGSLDDPGSIAAIAQAQLGYLATYAQQIEKSAL